jgi:hypothetical protein
MDSGKVVVKDYKINKTWGISCTQYPYGLYVLEIRMISVPWSDVTERYSTTDKDDANRRFKELVEKYKAIGECDVI